MRATILTALSLLLLVPTAQAQIPPETVGSETMAPPEDNWFISKSGRGGYIYDAETGEMHGLLSLSNRTPAVEVSRERGEFYAAEGYYSRGVHGERTDIVAVYDFENLSPIAEIEIPQKVEGQPVRRHAGLTGNGRYFLVFNMTPAQSVTVVDVENRVFVGEISTPGCAVIMPVDDLAFMTICGDGMLQLIQLDEDGTETNRVRGNSFFDVQVDPVFDRPEPTADGWWLVSHEGKAFDVSVDGSGIVVSEAWDLLAGDDQWRPGGRQLYSVHAPSGYAYILMHEGGEYTHYQPGTEIWVYDINAQRRVERIELAAPASSLFVTQSDEPKLIVADQEGGLHVYDAVKLTVDRTIDDPGPLGLIQGF